MAGTAAFMAAGPSKRGPSMRKIGWLFGVALFVAAGAPAMAQDQAAQIKQAVEDALKPLAGTGAPGEEAALSHGAVDVAAAGPAYVVTVPDLKFTTGTTGQFEIGTVSFSLTPEGDDLYHIADVKIPAEIPHKTADGSVDGTISLPSQQFTGVWSRSLESFTQLDAALRDVKVASTADSMMMALGEIAMKIASTDKGNGRWDQDGTVHLSALNVTGPDGAFALGSIDGTSTTRDYNAKGLAALRDRMEAMTENMAEHPETPAQMPDPQLIEAMRNASPLFASTNSTFTVNDISFHSGMGQDDFSLPTGTLTFGAEGFDQPMGRITLSLNHTGLVIGDIPPVDQDLLPKELAVNIALENLPVQELWKGAIDTLSSADMSTDEGSSMAMMMFMGLLQQSLVNGKARVNVTDTHLAMALARAQLGGVIEASADSMFGAVGKMTVDVTGLDALIEAVMAHGGPQSEEATGLQVVRGFSNRQTAADGAVTDHYDLDFTPQGQFLVNGKEFSFMGPGGGEPPPDGGMAPDASAPPADDASGDAAPPPPDDGSGDTTNSSN
jgi:hypothetical protein